MTRRIILGGILGLGLLCLFALAVLAATGISPADLRREARLAFGLPKFWQTNFVEDVASRRAVTLPR